MKTKQTKENKDKPKYKRGDIVGVVANAMYEFKILSYSRKYKLYSGECTHSYMKEIKIGDKYAITPKQIVVKLGEKGKKWPVPTMK
jgi:hypothetical protein